MTVMQFTHELWNALKPVNYLIIIIWVVIFIDFIDKRLHR